MQSKSKTKLWLERLGVAMITVVALGAPFVLGFVGYIGLRPEGIFFNEGDPQRETHVWMERERQGPVGIYWQRALQKAGADGKPCTYANLTSLRWRPKLQLESNDGGCL